MRTVTTRTTQPRSQRPRVRKSTPERQQQLTFEAARLFHLHGYPKVTIADIAAAAQLSPPAVYRHFPSKAALLSAAVSTGLDSLEAILNPSSETAWPVLVGSLAQAAVDRNDLWGLVQRDIRYLRAEERKPLTDRFARSVIRMREHLARRRPDLHAIDIDLLTTAVFAVLASDSTYAATASGSERARLLSSAALQVAATWTPQAQAQAEPLSAAVQQTAPPDASPGDRRKDEIVAAAVDLIARDGYWSVSLDDIGASVGMAGPSVLHHFPTKADILERAIDRAVESVGTLAPDGRQPSLEDLVSTFTAMAVREHQLFRVYVTESRTLPSAVGIRVRSALREDVAGWSSALAEHRQDIDHQQRMILTTAARAIVHDVVRFERYLARSSLRTELVDLVMTTMTTPVTAVEKGL